ncbi:MAG: hypothetical protein ACI8PZ_004100 [Myxococcota bacterium]|jgi:hypothetical protein
MRSLLLLALALAVPAIATAMPTLSVSGDCPGPLDISVSGLTPGGNMTLLFSSGEGAGLVPAGACRGAETGLDPVRWVLTAPDGDGDGAMSFSPTVPPSACGMHMQVLDAGSCTLSSVETVGGGGGPVLVGAYSPIDGPPVDVYYGEVLNCTEACALNFGGDSADYQCSTSPDSLDGNAWFTRVGDYFIGGSCELRPSDDVPLDFYGAPCSFIDPYAGDCGVTAWGGQETYGPGECAYYDPYYGWCEYYDYGGDLECAETNYCWSS